MPAKLHPGVEVHSDDQTAVIGSERHDSGSIISMNPRGTSTLALALAPAPAQNGPGAFVGRATARPEDRASQGSQHHHPLKRDRRTHAAWPGWVALDGRCEKTFWTPATARRP